MASLETTYQQFLQKIEDLAQEDSNGSTGFTRDFLSLRKASSSYKSDEINYAVGFGRLPINKVKNRFKDILPFDSTRVELPDTGVEGSDYINANYIKGTTNQRTYIASQGPLPNTVNDFWRMLWSYNVRMVVMLCRETEGGKKKCQRYWPKNTDDNVQFNGISVKMKKVVGVGDNIVMRTLNAECDGEEKTFTQFHYTAWPDHGVPDAAAPLIELLKLVRKYQPEDEPPIVFHCSAGCGRTGTICALDIASCLLNQNRANEIDPYDIVTELRKQRPAMVQTKAQYEFMCHSMLALFRAKLGLPIDEDMENHLYENVTSACYSDSDSEAGNLSPLALTPQNSFSSTTLEKSGHVSGNIMVDSSQNGQKKNGRGTQQPSSSYMNVSFDLIDLSDDNTNASAKHKTAHGPISDKKPFIPQRTSLKGRNDKPGVSEKTIVDGRNKSQVKKPSDSSSEDYVIPNYQPQKSKSSETVGNKNQVKQQLARQKSLEAASDDIQQLRKTPVNKSPPATIERSHKRPNLPTKPQDDKKYENVRIPLSLPPPFKVQNRLPATGQVTQPCSYENVDVALAKTQPKIEQRRPVLPRRESNEKPASPSKPEFLRRGSGREQGVKMTAKPKQPVSYGRKSGQNISNALPRAKVLPKDSTKEEKESENDMIRQQHFMEDLSDGLYSQVNRRRKSNNRLHLNDANHDSIDGENAPTRSPDHLATEENHDVQREMASKSKGSSLTNKFSALLLKKSDQDVRVAHIENIGFGIRLPKPTGPRDPPKSWMVNSR